MKYTMQEFAKDVRPADQQEISGRVSILFEAVKKLLGDAYAMEFNITPFTCARIDQTADQGEIDIELSVGDMYAAMHTGARFHLMRNSLTSESLNSKILLSPGDAADLLEAVVAKEYEKLHPPEKEPNKR